MGNALKAAIGGKRWVVLAALQKVHVLRSANNISITPRVGSRDIVVNIATRYGAGRSRDRIPVEARFSSPVQTGPEAHPALLYNGYRVFPRGKAAGAWR